MSRRGFGRGGRGRGRGRGGRTSFGGFDFSALGTTYMEVMSQPRDPEEKYPPLKAMPDLVDLTEAEKRAIEKQIECETKLRQSQYFMVPEVHSDALPRYSDRFRPSATRPSLNEADLNSELLPREAFQLFFHPKQKKPKKVIVKKRGPVKKEGATKITDIDKIIAGAGLEKDGGEDEENAEEEDEDDGEEDEAMDEYEDEMDDDYNDNYFDNGEEDNMDDMGLGDDGGGAVADYDW